MKAKQTIPALGACAVLLAAGIASAQPQPERLVPPVDQFGPVVGPLGPLQMPSDPGPNWTLDERARLYALQMGGKLTERRPDQVRVQREGEPDAILFVRPATRWFFEGRAVTPDLVPEGSEVTARFDLEGNKRIATRIEAAPPGSGLAAAGELDPGAVGPPPVAAEMPGSAVDDPRAAEAAGE